MYDRNVEGELLTFGVSGMLYRNGLIMYDRETESLWSHILGQAVGGDYQGTSLTFLPALQTTWSEWLKRQPETLVVNPTLYSNYDVYDGYYWSADAGVIPRAPNSDTRLPPKQYIIGVRLNGDVRAYPFEVLSEEPVVNDTMADIPLVVFFDKASSSGAVFERTLPDGTLLEFTAGAQPDRAVDSETQSEWDIFTGTALSGPLAGTQLTQVPITYAFWFGWADYHDNSSIYGR